MTTINKKIVIVIIMKTEDEVTIGKDISTMINANTEITVLARIGEMKAKREISIKEIIVYTHIGCIIDILEKIAKTQLS